MANCSHASEDSIVASKSFDRRRARLIQPRVRSTNACTMLPSGGFVGRRWSGWSVRRRNAEDDLDAGVVDFDPAHENTDDLLHAGPIEIVEARGHFGREVFQTADHERKVTLDLGRFERGVMALLELG